MDKIGYIYILTNKSFRDNCIKIGYSINVERRVKDLSGSGLPYDYEIYATYEIPASQKADKALHKIIQMLNPNLRITPNREFLMEAYKMFEEMAIIHGREDKLKLYKNDEVDKDLVIWSLASGLNATWATITQPIKAGARKLGKTFIETTFKKGFLSFLNSFKNVLIKICAKIVPIIKKSIGWFAKKFVQSLTATTLASSLIGALTSATINTILDIIVTNITIFLSIGGLVAGLLDWVSDKKLDNKIKLDFWN